MDIINTDNFKAHVENLLTQWHVPGLSIAVFDQESVTTAGFGFAKLDPPVRASPDTIYDMASTSKSLTAAAVGKLISDEKRDPRIKWDTPMSTLLPEDFVLSDAQATEKVTIEDILSHRSGLPRHDDSCLGINGSCPDTPRSITKNLRNLPLTASLRTKYQYCNLMYTAASYLVEELSGIPFSRFLQQKFFDVLGMTSTYLQPSAAISAGHSDRLATRHVWDKEQQKYKALEPSEQPEGQGAGSIQSTVKDYAKWVQAMMRMDESLLPEETYKALIQPRIICEPKEDKDSLKPFTSHELYAMGWSVRSYRGHQIIEHDGLIFGVASSMLYMPSINFGMVVCGNADEAPAVNEILAIELIDHMLKVPLIDRVDWVAREKKKSEEAEDEKTGIEEIQQEICPEGVQPLHLPLKTFTGTFENAGYHKIIIDIQNDCLHIDGSDRSEPFHMFFEHVCENKNFIATITEVTGEKLHWKSKFRFSEAGTVVAVGIAFVDEMEGEVIWFDKI